MRHPDAAYAAPARTAIVTAVTTLAMEWRCGRKRCGSLLIQDAEQSTQGKWERPAARDTEEAAKDRAVDEDTLGMVNHARAFHERLYISMDRRLHKVATRCA